jgi:hypothetical protein
VLVVRWLEPDVAEDMALASVVAWYERRGYTETSRRPIEAVYSEDAASLTIEALDIVTMRKPL